MSIPWSSDWWWWMALLVQLLAIPGTLFPLLPGLIWLPVGGLIWIVAVGWQQAWPELVVALVLFGLGLVADLLALGLVRPLAWCAGGGDLGHKKATPEFGVASGAAPGIRGGIGCCGRTSGESSGSIGLGTARCGGFYWTQLSLRKPVWSSVPNSWR